MATKKKEKMVSIKLPRVPGKPGQIFVSVGERQWMVKRGVNVEIPECAYDVLRNAQLAEDVAVSYISTAPTGINEVK